MENWEGEPPGEPSCWRVRAPRGVTDLHPPDLRWVRMFSRLQRDNVQTFGQGPVLSAAQDGVSKNVGSPGIPVAGHERSASTARISTPPPSIGTVTNTTTSHRPVVHNLPELSTAYA
jgi:hypothetical protein